MFTNDGDTEGLFRAGIMNSGTSAATGDVTELQDTFDFVVQQVGCANATDALACLRSVPAESLVAVADNTTAVTDYRVSSSERTCERMLIFDSDFRVFVPQPPQKLLAQGRAANIPFIIGTSPM